MQVGTKMATQRFNTVGFHHFKGLFINFSVCFEHVQELNTLINLMSKYLVFRNRSSFRIRKPFGSHVYHFIQERVRQPIAGK